MKRILLGVVVVMGLGCREYTPVTTEIREDIAPSGETPKSAAPSIEKPESGPPE